MKQSQSKITLPTILFLGLLAAGCQPVANNSNGATAVGNSSASNRSANASSADSATANMANTGSSATMIETREPEKYQATVTLKIETLGEKTAVLPPLTAEVARDGASQRMEFAVPNSEKIVYLDRTDKRFLILPNRKQFAELNQDSLGFEVRQLMTPGQIVAQAKNFKGVERVGEEQLNNRSVVKYRYNATNNTNTQAGNVTTESFVYVDQETGLPLRSETVSESQNGNVRGVKGVRLVTELSNIRTEVAPELFVEPQDYKKVAPEEVRSQVNAIFSLAAGFFGQMMQNAQQQPNSGNNPAASPTP